MSRLRGARGRSSAAMYSRAERKNFVKNLPCVMRITFTWRRVDYLEDIKFGFGEFSP